MEETAFALNVFIGGLVAEVVEITFGVTAGPSRELLAVDAAKA